MLTYEKTREDFYTLYDRLSKNYKVELHKHPIKDGLTLDIIEIIPEKKEKLLCITTGLHGIEGYLGHLLINEFVENYLERIDVKTTHIILVHSINPYGMKYRRKVNEDNIDLNRNFLTSFEKLPQNNGYQKNKKFLLPKKLKNYTLEKMKFVLNVGKVLLTGNQKDFKEAVLLGQYDYPLGFYYGGKKEAKSTEVMKHLYKELTTEKYQKRVFIDLHTGYGPRNQMSIVNSTLEKRSVDEMKQAFNYFLIQKTDGEDFYKIEGDMVDYINTLIGEDDYATCFEFGTIGDNLTAQMKSLRIMIEENSVSNIKTNNKVLSKVKKAFDELYFPDNIIWLGKAKRDFNQAITGILKYYQYIKG